jgi:hypothetical protein
MTIEALKSISQARPFRPFILHLADGRHLSVRHPEFLSDGPDATEVTVGHPDGTSTVVALASIDPRPGGPDHRPWVGGASQGVRMREGIDSRFQREILPGKANFHSGIWDFESAI